MESYKSKIVFEISNTGYFMHKRGNSIMYLYKELCNMVKNKKENYGKI